MAPAYFPESIALLVELSPRWLVQVYQGLFPKSRLP